MKENRRQYPHLASMTGVLLLPLSALAQTDNIQHELGKCAAIADINARVACYDALAHPQPGKPRANAPAVDRIETSAQPRPMPTPSEKGEEPLLAKVASLKEIQPNKWRITLANGQIWQQTVGKVFLIGTNDTVRIARSGWGRSFRLSIAGHPDYIQVSRLE